MEPELWFKVKPESEPKINYFGSATLQNLFTDNALLWGGVGGGGGGGGGGGSGAGGVELQ